MSLLSQLLVGRFLVGISIGIVGTALSMMTEIAPKAHRGRSILVIPGTAYAFGQVSAITHFVCRGVA